MINFLVVLQFFINMSINSSTWPHYIPVVALGQCESVALQYSFYQFCIGFMQFIKRIRLLLVIISLRFLVT